MRAFIGIFSVALATLVLVGLACDARQHSSASAPALSRPPVEVQYTANDEPIANPERGFFHAFNPTGGGRVGQQDKPHPPLKVEELRRLRTEEGITLVRDYILIPRKFWGEPVSQAYLDELQGNFDAVRAAGMKVIVRFLYDWGMTNRDPDEKTILRHLDELAPLIRKNADAIAWMQAGLFGGCGEANASDHGYVFDKHIRLRDGSRWQGLSPAGVRAYKRLLEVLPPERMLAVRYPRLKWDLLGLTPEAATRPSSASAAAATTHRAYDGPPAGRIGFCNEGFMGNEDHYAMFVLPGEKEFAAADTEFVVHEGEISNASPYKMKARQVAADMERYHVTALNRGGDEWPKVATQWKANGDYDTIARRMGYRFRLVRAWLPAEAHAGGALNIRIEMVNDGFARPINARAIELVLRQVDRSAATAQSTAPIRLPIDSKVDTRLLLPGPGQTKMLDLSCAVPKTVAPGHYELLLALPDPAKSLHDRPEYSIRLANEGVWEPTSGFNKLNHIIIIGR